MSWSVVAAIAGIAAVVVTVVYGEIQRRLAQRQLRLAEEQAELRPQLRLSATYSEKGTTVAHADGVLNCIITNGGQTTAHNVYCALQLEEPRRVEFVGHGQPSSYRIGVGDLPLRSPYPFDLNVQVHSHGLVRGRYWCTCDEAPEAAGEIEVEVPVREP